MISWSQILGIASASILIIAAPGPGVLFVVGKALAIGRSAAMLALIGIGLGAYTAATFVSLGLGAFIQTQPWFLDVLRVAGGIFLVGLGVHAWWRASRPSSAADMDAVSTESARSAIGSGFIVGVTNPKVYVLFAALLPQFVTDGGTAPQIQMLELALVPVLIALVTDSVWAIAASAARASLNRNPRRLVRVGQIGGLTVVGLGIWLVVESQL